MDEKTKLPYRAPVIEVLDLNVEAGFAASGDPGGYGDGSFGGSDPGGYGEGSFGTGAGGYEDGEW